MLDDQSRWDRLHAEGEGGQAPSRFLQEIIDGDQWALVPGKALDLACGKGRNALFLASRGFEVTAIDISTAGLERGREQAKAKGLSIIWQQADLETFELPDEVYDLIVNVSYLQRSLISRLKSALKPGGYVIFETYLIDQRAIGHPKNPDYLLAHNELLEHFRDFRVMFYREGMFSGGGERSYRAGLFARKIA
ncbi:MAG TPA: class I SAM-dependent methyltransferase [Candidatus Binatia bacterium]|nr:class I SAM-dependent methyltransferase [Candidatus Binatia bacterium]